MRAKSSAVVGLAEYLDLATAYHVECTGMLKTSQQPQPSRPTSSKKSAKKSTSKPKSRDYTETIEIQRVSVVSDDVKGSNSNMRMSMNVIEEEKKVDAYIKASEVIQQSQNGLIRDQFTVESVKAPSIVDDRPMVNNSNNDEERR